jgi:hypothetical protein
MLKKENEIYKSQGQIAFQEYGLTSVEPTKIINRLCLSFFGFNTNDESVANYREIFRTYYNSAVDYDKEVLDCVLYMRHNRCLFYTEIIINIGNMIPDCLLYKLDKTKVTLNNIITKTKTLICGFSKS